MMIKRKTFLICAAILPFMLFMTGCGGGYAEEEYNPNEQHIYVHQEDDPVYDMYMLQQMQRQNTQDLSDSLDKSMENTERNIRMMGQSDMQTLDALRDAQMQQNLYNQQQRQQHFGR